MTVSLGPQKFTVLDAVATAATKGIGVPIAVGGRDEVVVYFQSNGTTSGGTLVIEEASYPAETVYAGTWSTIGATINASSFTGTAQVAYHISPNCYDYIRVRIATDITGGGTVTVYVKVQ